MFRPRFSLSALTKRRSPATRRASRPARHARLEPLEDRTLLSVQFTIDPLENIQSISPFIYGINPAGQTEPANLTLTRSGGNSLTTYNWVNNANNAGSDWYFNNYDLMGGDTTLTSGISASATTISVANAATIATSNTAIASTPNAYVIWIDSEQMKVTAVNTTANTLTVARGAGGTTASTHASGAAVILPGGAMIPTLQSDYAQDQATLLTIPINGYVAADTGNGVNGPGGNVMLTPNYLQTRFKREVPFKNAPFTLTPNPASPTVAENEFVNWVKSNFPYGQTDPTRPIWFSLDNEPDLWASTHAEVQSSPLTYAELIENSMEYSMAIKSVDPNTLVFGPASYGWEGYLTLQNAPDAYGRDFLDYYLQQMQQASFTAGERLLDALDVHFYTSTPNDPADIMQAPRSLWDPTYMENSWIAQSIPGPIELIPRLQAKINQFYPGTKLSISEYNYGGGDSIAGAIAEADALGIYGRQGLFAAAEWPLSSTQPYIDAAMEMYRNFDGSDGAFGNTSVQAATNDVNDTSIYASVDSANPSAMTLVAINKSSQSLTANMLLDHVQPGSTATFYQLTSASTTPVKTGTATISNPNDFTYTMPAESVTTIRITLAGSQNKAPTVATPAKASASTVTTTSTGLSVLGSDAAGEKNLTYTWATTGTPPASVTFSANGSNAAKNTVAIFDAPGTYSFLATITDPSGYFATSSVSVTVDSTLTHIAVTPPNPNMPVSGQQQFAATGTDQFGNTMATPPSFAWSASAGTITSAGVFTAPTMAGNSTVTAAAGGIQGSTTVAVVNPTTITVTTASDAALRTAVATADTDVAAGTSATILFAASLDGDTITLNQPLELKAGSGTVTIDGGGLITISGGGYTQLFRVDSNAQVVLNGLSIEDGNAYGGSGGGIANAGTLTINNSTLSGSTAGNNSGSGGAIDNTGNLTLTNVIVTGNSAGTSGGGIDNEQGGTLSMTNVTFSGNSSPTGGGVNNAGTMTILGATFSGNKAGGSSGNGGGIDNSGTLTLTNANLTGNSASGGGGGICNGGLMTVTGSTIENNTASYIAGGINNIGTMTVTNSTVAGNYAYLGGGIYNGNYWGLSGALTLTGDTITSNFADYGAGGGIYMANGSYSSTGGSTLTMLDTLVAGNFASGNSNDFLSNPVAPFGPDVNVYSGTLNGAYNLIGDGQGLTGISNGDANHNLVGTPAAPINAMLAAALVNAPTSQSLTSTPAAFNISQIPLANNGGPTPMIALMSGSPAIGAAGAVTTVTGSVSSSAVTIPVADAVAIACTPGQYYILIDGEEMEVTNVSLATNSLTVSRGINGVTATLKSNDPVYLYCDQRGVPRLRPPISGPTTPTARARR